MFLFDPNILDNLNWDCESISPLNIDSNFKLRPLRKDDYDKGFLDVLAQLTTVGEIALSAFEG